MLKNWIRRWLYLDTITASIIDLQNDYAGFAGKLRDIETNVRVGNAAAGRIIAKLDPGFAANPGDQYTYQYTRDNKPIPTPMRAESDKLAEQVLARLKAEDLARRHTTGDL